MPRNKSEKDPPTEVWSGGTKIWKDDNGLFHRVGAPACIRPSGSRFWYRHGVLHREGGPAIEYADGNVEWWLHGRRPD